MSAALYICSCDAYLDTWSVQRWALKRWYHASYTVYWGSESFIPNDKAVRFVSAPAGLAWSGTVVHHLRQIGEEYVLLLLDDLPLSGPLKDSLFQEMCELAGRRNLDMIRLNTRPFPEGQLLSANSKLAFCGPSLAGQIVLQPALWRRTALLDLLVASESAWDFERNACRRACSSEKFAGVLCTRVSTGGVYFHHVIEKRQWIPVEYVYFRMRGVKIESKRPVMGISEFFGLLVSEITNSLLRLLFKKQAREVRERLRDALPALIYTKFAKWRKY